MKKIVLLVALVAAFSACGGQARKGDVFNLEEVNSFIKEVSKNTADFSEAQWAKLQIEYDNLLKKANEAKEKLSPEEKKALENLKETFEARKKEDMKKLEKLQDEAKDALDKATDNIEKEIKDKVEDAGKAIEKGAKEAKKQASKSLEDASDKLKK